MRPCPGGVRGVKPGGGPGDNSPEPGCRSVRFCDEGTVDKVSPSEQEEQYYGVRSAPGPSFALSVLTRFVFFRSGSLPLLDGDRFLVVELLGVQSYRSPTNTDRIEIAHVPFPGRSALERLRFSNTMMHLREEWI